MRVETALTLTSRQAERWRSWPKRPAGQPVRHPQRGSCPYLDPRGDAARRAVFGEFVRRERISLATITADAPTSLSAIRTAPERLALIMGGERDGISADLEALTSYRYAIPMTPDVESLNVSVAAAIALYEHRRT